MLHNYIKLAFRKFWKNKLTTGINIFGLSFGIACASMAFVFIKHEMSFNKFHDDHENIYWLYTKVGEEMNLFSTPGVLSPSLKENFPEVTEYLRFTDKEISIRSGNEIFKEDAHFVDPNFFDFFSFSLKDGNPENVLTEINSVVISEDIAKKYFGRKNPIGETLPISIIGEEIFEITGVAENAPSNSSLQFDFLLPINVAFKNDVEQLNTDWGQFYVTSFMRLRDNKDLESLSQKMPDYINEKYEAMEDSWGEYTFPINAFDDYHLNNERGAGGLLSPADKNYVKILAIIALLILIVACLNFMNLSNAQGSQRLTEVGVRQVMGAQRRELMSQFLTESILVSFFSLLLAVALIESFLPFSAALFNYPLNFDWTTPTILLSLIGIALITGLLAGIYPSFLLSKLNTVNAFKSGYKIGGNNWATKSSLVFQFAISIGLVACTYIMFQQQKFISEQDLGFDKEEVVVIATQVSYEDKIDSERLIKQFRSEAQKINGVVQVAGVSNSFNQGNRVVFYEGENGQMEHLSFYRIDSEYLDLLDIEIMEGRNFSEDFPGDPEKSMIVNEAFIKQFEIENIETHQFSEKLGGLAGRKIIGVVKDYHFDHLRQVIKPVQLTMRNDIHMENILVKIKTEKVPETLAQLKTTWQNVRPEKPFECTFMDDDIQRQYESEIRWGNVLKGASLLAIVIAFLGLFGLVALVLAERTKEIGIRKVLGATVLGIVSLLSKDFIRIVLFAFIIATPLAYYFMGKWLEDFAYRIELQWWMFALAGMAVIALAFLTMSFQSIKAAMANPVDSLRSE